MPETSTDIGGKMTIFDDGTFIIVRNMRGIQHEILEIHWSSYWSCFYPIHFP